MISPAVLIREYLIDALLLQAPSGEASWPVYLNSLPDGTSISDDAVGIYDALGKKDGRLMVGDTIEHYGVMISLRSKEHSDGWDKMNSISIILDALLNQDIVYNTVTYRLHSVTRDLVRSLGNESSTKRRFLFEQKLLVTAKQL